MTCNEASLSYECIRKRNIDFRVDKFYTRACGNIDRKSYEYKRGKNPEKKLHSLYTGFNCQDVSVTISHNDQRGVCCNQFFENENIKSHIAIL